MMYERTLFFPAGDQALVVELGETISPEINRRVHDLTLAIEDQDIQGVIDLAPTYRSLLVQYDPSEITIQELQASVSRIEEGLAERPRESPRVVHIPTLYGGVHGPDVEFVAEHAGLTPEEVVSIHSGTDYLVYMLGFTPGFPYLGGLSDRLATPRLATPRVETPAGSVGIAESQTGVYPSASPGGWRLIGRTPLTLFDSRREPPSMMSAGDFVRFVPIADEEEYAGIQNLVQKGEYRVSWERMR